MKSKMKVLKALMAAVSVLTLAAGGLVVANSLLNGEFALPTDILGGNLWEKNLEDLRAEYDADADDLKTQREERKEKAELTNLDAEEIDLPEDPVPLAEAPELPKDKPSQNNNSRGDSIAEQPDLPSGEIQPEIPVPEEPVKKPEDYNERRKQEAIPEVELITTGYRFIDNIPGSNIIYEGDSCVENGKNGDVFNLSVRVAYPRDGEAPDRIEVYQSGKLLFSGTDESVTLPVNITPGGKYSFKYVVYAEDKKSSQTNYFQYLAVTEKEVETDGNIILKQNKIDKTVITVGEGTEIKSNILEILCQKNSQGKRIIKGQVLRITPGTFLGEKLFASNIRVVIDNHEITSPTGNGVYEYILWGGTPTAGDKIHHKIEIIVDDEHGNLTEEIYEFDEDLVGEGVEIGTATIRVDCTTVGMGVINEIEVPICSEEPVSVQVMEALKEMGYDVNYSGSMEQGLYLEGIKDGSAFKHIKIPEILWNCVIRDGIPVYLDEIKSLNNPERIEGDWLEEFAFTRWSGWMYCVNGYYPGRGMSDYYLKDGDVVELRFTLCLGKDIGGYAGGGYDGGNFKKYCGTWINGIENIHHEYDEHEVCRYCGAPSELHEHIYDENNCCLYCDAHEHNWVLDEDIPEWSGENTYTCKICGATKSEPKTAPSKEVLEAREIEEMINALTVHAYILNEEEGKQIEAVRESYEKASKKVQRQVSQEAIRKLELRETQYADLVSAVEKAKSIDEKVLNFGEVTYESGELLKAIQKEYNESSEATKRNVTVFGGWHAERVDDAPFYVLLEKYEEIYNCEHALRVAAELKERIAELGEVIEGDSAAEKEIKEIAKLYAEELLYGEKAAVDNISVFFDAQSKLAAFKINELEAYKEVSVESEKADYWALEEALSEVYLVWSKMPEEAKALVSEEAKQVYAEAKERKTVIENAWAAAEAESIISRLEKVIENVSEASIADIIEARKAYDKLNDAAKALVTNADLIEKAQDEYDKFAAPSQAYEVEEEIRWIMTVTLESEEQILKAREMYEALSKYAKAMVENYDILVEAEKRLEELKNPVLEEPENNPVIIPEEHQEEHQEESEDTPSKEQEIQDSPESAETTEEQEI